MKAAQLKQIIKLATNRRNTLIARLARAQAQQNDVKCDEIYAAMARENELIENATRDLKYAV